MAIPWLTIIIALISFFASKKSGKSTGDSAAIAAAAGAVTYGVTEYTDWGQENLKPIDDSINGWFGTGDDKSSSSITTTGTTGGQTGTSVVTVPASSGSSTGAWDTLKSWGPMGTAAVVGTAGAATGTLDKSWLWVGGGLLLFALLR